jgi:ubiquinone/menaquinone biosynthesis C-methylase UbiE
VADSALELVGLTAGAELLDIASGGGALSIPAARQGANVTAIDFLTAMVELLNRKAAQAGLTNLTAHEMDGTALEFENEKFDIACSQWGIMLFPYRKPALREMCRVTKNGGRGMMVVFGPPQQVPMFSLGFQALRLAVPAFTPPANSPLFSLQDPSRLRSEMEEAGFSAVRVTSQVHNMAVGSSQSLWNILERSAPASAGLLQQFSDAQKVAGVAKLGELLRDRFGDAPYQLPITTHVGIGTK